MNQRFRRSRLLGSGAVVTALVAGLIWYAVPSASANDGIPEGAPPMEFVNKSFPQWNFARAHGNNSCFPVEAIMDFTGDPNSGRFHEGVDPANWPNADPAPQCPEQFPERFPTYWSYKKCSDSEIRTSFTIYIPTNAFEPSGHRHDFEGIIVVWTRNGDAWTRNRLLMSRHGKYPSRPWNEVESWNSDGSSAGLGREYPRIFVGWGSHAMFNDQGGLKDVLSQYTDLEWRDDGGSEGRRRGANHWLVEVTDNNALAERFDQNQAWSGYDRPSKVSRELCSKG